MRFLPLLLLPLPLLASPFSRAPVTSAPRGLSVNATSAIKSLFERWSITGAVVAYVLPGKDEVLSFGKRDVMGNNVTHETYWAIASNTKLFTALAISMMIEDGVKLPNGQALQITSLMKDVYPAWGMKNATVGQGITLLDVMTMRTGLPQHILSTTPSDTPITAIGRTPFLNINTVPGQNGTFQYSNHNYEILGALPSLLLNKSIEAYVDERILTPLGMGGTRNATLAKEKGRSMGFFRSAPNVTACNAAVLAGGNVTDLTCLGRPEGFEYWTEGNGGFYGGAGMNLRGVDMIKWAKELINPTIFPSSLTARIQTLVPSPLNNTNAPANASAITETIGYQAGLVSQWYRGHRFYLHDGAVAGSNSYFAWSPESGVGVFAAANDDAYSVFLNGAVANTVLDDLLGLEPIDWEARTIADLTGGAGVETGTSTPQAPDGSVNSSTPASRVFRPPPADYTNTTYSDPAYGNFTLLPLNLSSLASFAAARIPAEWYLNAIAIPSGLNLTAPAYYAVYNHTFVSHLVFTHFDGPIFNYTAILVKDRLNANGAVDGLTGKLLVVSSAVFDGGIGMFGNFALKSASIPEVPVVEEGVKEVAPVFFARA